MGKQRHRSGSALLTAKLISAFVFTTCIVQFLFYLYPKCQNSSFLLWVYRPVCVGPDRKSGIVDENLKTGPHFSSCISLSFPLPIFQDMQVNCLAVINDTVGALMSCAHQDRECAIGLILGKLTVSAGGWGV